MAEVMHSCYEYEGSFHARGHILSENIDMDLCLVPKKGYEVRVAVGDSMQAILY